VSSIPLSRKRKADSIFEDMVAQESQEVEVKMNKTVSHQSRESKKNKVKKQKKEKLQDVSQSDVCCLIFCSLGAFNNNQTCSAFTS
jgi:hypothetical protein